MGGADAGTGPIRRTGYCRPDHQGRRLRSTRGALSSRHGDAEPRGTELAECLGATSGEASRQEARKPLPWPGGSVWCFTGCGGMAPSSASRARARWGFGRHKRGRIPSAASKERRKEPRLKVGDPPLSPRRDAVPDDARNTSCLLNHFIAFEHAEQIGTRESFWTRHEVGSRRADHGRKREPGDGHIRNRGSFTRPGTRCNRPTPNRCRAGAGSARTTPGDTTCRRRRGFANEPSSRDDGLLKIGA